MSGIVRPPLIPFPFNFRSLKPLAEVMVQAEMEKVEAYVEKVEAGVETAGAEAAGVEAWVKYGRLQWCWDIVSTASCMPLSNPLVFQSSSLKFMVNFVNLQLMVQKS